QPHSTRVPYTTLFRSLRKQEMSWIFCPRSAPTCVAIPMNNPSFPILPVAFLLSVQLPLMACNNVKADEGHHEPKEHGHEHQHPRSEEHTSELQSRENL